MPGGYGFRDCAKHPAANDSAFYYPCRECLQLCRALPTMTRCCETKEVQAAFIGLHCGAKEFVRCKKETSWPSTRGLIQPLAATRASLRSERSFRWNSQPQ